MRIIIIPILIFNALVNLSAQEQNTDTVSIAKELGSVFNDSRVVTVQSTETLRKGMLDLRASFRFGDIASNEGGWSSFFGMDRIADVAAGAEYGVTDDITVGAFASRGTGLLRQNVHGSVKIKLLSQNNSNIPLSASIFGLGSLSTMDSGNPEGSFIETFQHRLAYHASIILARNFNDLVSFQFHGGYTYRSIVLFDDENDLFNIGGALKLHLTQNIGLLVDGNYILSDTRNSNNGYYPAIGAGIELKTNEGDILQVNITNARGIFETDFLPYTTSNWRDGEFRVGFTLSKKLKVNP